MKNTADGIGMLRPHAAGLKTSVLGNSDTYDQFNRGAVTIAMDKWGRVDYGNVSLCVSMSPKVPLVIKPITPAFEGSGIIHQGELYSCGNRVPIGWNSFTYSFSPNHGR